MHLTVDNAEKIGFIFFNEIQLLKFRFAEKFNNFFLFNDNFDEVEFQFLKSIKKTIFQFKSKNILKNLKKSTVKCDNFYDHLNSKSIREVNFKSIEIYNYILKNSLNLNNSTFNDVNLIKVYRMSILLDLIDIFSQLRGLTNFLEKKNLKYILIASSTRQISHIISKNISKEFSNLKCIGVAKKKEKQLVNPKLRNFLWSIYFIKEKIDYLKKSWIKTTKNSYNLSTRNIKINFDHRRLLILIVSENQFQRVIIVLNELIKEKDLDIYALLMPTVATFKNIAYLNSIKIFTFDISNDLSLYRKSRELYDFNSWISNYFKKEIYNFDRKSPPKYPNERNLIHSILLKNFTKFPILIKIQQIMQQCFRKIQPSLSIYLNEYIPESKIFEQLSKKYGSKLIFIPHCAAGGYLYEPLTMDYAFLSGAMENMYYSSLPGSTKSKTQVIITGSPHYDKLFQLKEEKIKNKSKIIFSLKKKLKLTKETKIILLVTNPINKTLLEIMIKSVVLSANQYEDVHLIIKLHPREFSSDFHTKIVNTYGNPDKTTILKHGNIELYDLFLICDIVVGRLTNALIEAVLFDKNVIDLDYDNYGDLYNLHKYDSEIRITDPKNLNEFVKKLLNNEEIVAQLKKGRKVYENLLSDGKKFQSAKIMKEKIIEILKSEN
ncbi:hypothetical protein NEF87_004347 [Candidatus Lokiarchaeum ossiferum]|uniref:UDP-N-acetylglucosamine 2-epimerase domain-containing protein n=1 Tax=Candidatus Lokiarchaeum ossiferum TaxID=2951803 RepID=A0ABY6HX19_9ARCH|nr:hypothetical protein NEF87_004347 [Candidatus Lokiarchaeum sp. B-35]